jgi:hypothetical protein
MHRGMLAQDYSLPAPDLRHCVPSTRRSFDGLSRPRDNAPIVQRVRLANRIAAVALLLTLMPVAYAGVACAGWSPSAAERMACCQRSDGACATVSPDDCCGSREQRQNPESGTVVVVMPGPTRVTLAPSHSERCPVYNADLRALIDLPATHLLNSVFLI